MTYNSYPTTERINLLITRKAKDEGAQNRMDQMMLDAYLQKAFLNVKPSDKGNKVKAIGAGIPGFMVDQRQAVLTGPLFLRIISRGGRNADTHASDVLEPFVNGAVDCLQSEHEVRGLLEDQQLIYGEAYTLGPIPAPFFWADDEMREMAERKASKKEFDEYKASNFPVVWRLWDTPSTYAIRNDRGEPAEVIHCRKMTVDDIKARWGEESLPSRSELFGSGKYKDSEELEVTDYVNTKYIGVLIGKGKESKVTNIWEHHMGCTPVAYFGGGRLPANSYGLFRKGVLFHARELLHAIDTALTDISTNIHDWTTAPPYVTINPQLRGELTGWPDHIDYNEENIAINLVTGEVPGRWPVSQISIDVYQLINLAKEILNITSLREGLSGQGPSGQSAVHLTGSNQISKAELNRYHEGLKRGYKKVGELLLRCPAALNAEFKHVDKLTVRYIDRKHQSKSIEAGPEDTKGWEKLVSPEIDLNLPINEGGNVQNYSIATKSGGLSRATARERFLNVQNPYEEEDRKAEEDLYGAIVLLLQQHLTQRASGAIDAQGALSPLGLIQQAANLPQAAQEALAKSFSDEQSQELQELANASRGATSTARAGRGQQMSQLTGTNTEVPTA